MRSQARASSAGSTVGNGIRRGIFGFACLCVLGLAAFLGSSAPPAGAAPGEVPGRGFLPDNRGWEKVSEGEKGGFDARANPFGSASAAGSAVSFSTVGAVPGSVAGVLFSSLLASRDPVSGWAFKLVDPPVPSGSIAGDSLVQTSPHEPYAVVRSYSALTPDATERGAQLFLRNMATGAYELLTPVPTPPGPFQAELTPESGQPTPDFTSVPYQSAFAQAGDPVSAETAYPYLWTRGKGVQLISVLPGGGIPPTGAMFGSGLLLRYAGSALSADAKRAFFQTTLIPIAESPPDQLYVRENGESTQHVNASQRTDCAEDPTCGGDNIPDPQPDPAGTGQGAKFWNAEVEHGDRVIFTSCEKLTDDSTAQNCDKEDLYLFDVNTSVLTDLTTADPSGAGVVGVAGASDDLSRIYFVARGVLADGATAGELNLYLWDSGVTTFVAGLSPWGSYLPSGFDDPFVGDDNNVSFGASVNRARMNRVSPDGRYFLFHSRAQLTSYDNANPAACPPFDNAGTIENPEGLCQEIYLYDAVTEQTECVSCPVDGAPPVGDASPFSASRDALPSPQNLLDDGSRVFFDTPQALVNADSNGKKDVYQWEAGQVSLISTGKGGDNSTFADATPSGSDVFFLTRDRLTNTDTDSSRDLYDARVGGGFPEAPLGAPDCEGDACQPPPVLPGDLTPASSTFSGPGDPPVGSRQRNARKRCPKAKRKVRRQGKVRCVAKRAGRSRGGAK